MTSTESSASKISGGIKEEALTGEFFGIGEASRAEERTFQIGLNSVIRVRSNM